jgi:hypothetical protein
MAQFPVLDQVFVPTVLQDGSTTNRQDNAVPVRLEGLQLLIRLLVRHALQEGILQLQVQAVLLVSQEHFLTELDYPAHRVQQEHSLNRTRVCVPLVLMDHFRVLDQVYARLVLQEPVTIIPCPHVIPVWLASLVRHSIQAVKLAIRESFLSQMQLHALIVTRASIRLLLEVFHVLSAQKEQLPPTLGKVLV